MSWIDDCVVLIPYYEDSRGLRISLESIAATGEPSTLIVDDGSRSHPAELLLEDSRFAFADVLTLPVNLGIEGALNEGLTLLRDRYRYIARLDAGDTVTPNRFATQIEYLEANTDVVAVGSWVDFISDGGKYLYTYRTPVQETDLRKWLHRTSPLIHPSMMLRSDALLRAGGYPLGYRGAEDFALLHRLRQDGRLGNIGSVLTICTISESGLSSRNRKLQLRSRIRILLENFHWNRHAIWGLARAVGQLATPRSVSVLFNRLKRILLNTRGGGASGGDDRWPVGNNRMRDDVAAGATDRAVLEPGDYRQQDPED